MRAGELRSGDEGGSFHREWARQGGLCRRMSLQWIQWGKFRDEVTNRQRQTCGEFVLKFMVCVKQVPDSTAEKKLRADDSLLDRAGVDAVANELDENAIESALQISEANGGNGDGAPNSITLLSMGPERANETIRKGLSMGADDAIHLADAALAGSDALATSRALAAVIGTREVDVVFCGTESTDARMSVVPAMLAQRLGWPQLTFAGEVEVDANARMVRIKRMTDEGVEQMEAPMPCVVSVIQKINEPRYPSFKGIMAARKKNIVVLSLAEIGLSANEVGSAGAWSAVNDFSLRAMRSAGIKITDEGNAGDQLVAFLVTKKLV